MTYPQALRYLESFVNCERLSSWTYKELLWLERFQDFLALIGNPQDDLRCIHVAGSKGKGSTCAFAAYILREAGFKVGLYTSPHLRDFRERIRILEPNTPASPAGGQHPASSTEFEGMISKPELAGLITRLKPAIDKYNRASQYGALSFFEVYTALAFVYFKEKKADFVVLETGLGGRLDATNTVNPLVCAITPISLEHIQQLGDTLKKIATEKAGIIKDIRPSSLPRRQAGIVHRPSIVITAPQEKEALQVIQDRCKETGAKLYEVGKDIKYSKANPGFCVQGILGRYKNLKIKLRGRHQLINAGVAIGIIEALRRYGINIGINSIKRGLYNTVWPGRCEVVSRDPYIVLDGAQNAASARVLKKAIREDFGKYGRLILILGISSDKDIEGIAKELYSLADIIILTQANSPRAASTDFIAGIILKQHPQNKKPILETNSVAQARAQALGMANGSDLILVTGSLFVVGEFRGNNTSF